MVEHQQVLQKQLDLKERLDTFSQKEKDEINQSDEKSKLRSLIMKYGRAKVSAAELKRKQEEKRTGKKISWQEFKSRLENAKGRLKKGEVKTWDPDKKRWISNKEEDVNEEAPPTEKHERMVKHIKKSYKKDGKLTDQEKSIAYATAWKNYNKEKAK